MTDQNEKYLTQNNRKSKAIKIDVFWVRYFYFDIPGAYFFLFLFTKRFRIPPNIMIATANRRTLLAAS